jgi:protein-disulfide isomerase
LKSVLAALALVAATGSASMIAITNEEKESAAPYQPSSSSTSEDPSVEETRRAFLEDTVAPMVKPASYDVTIVEYTDYQCPFCRAAHDALLKLTAEDKKVRIIYRDWPIFGQPSERAARLAIASQWQGKHAAFHDALMKSPRPLTEQSIKAAAKKAGVDWSKLEADLKSRSAEVEALLARNDEQAMQLGLNGTPGFIIGETLYAGGMDLAGLKEAVADARKANGSAKTAKAGK